MRNGLTYVCRQLIYRITLQCQKREMGLHSWLQNASNAFNSSGRSRKFLFVLVFIVVLLYYLLPYIFRIHRTSSIEIDPNEDCLAQGLVEFQSGINNLNTFVSGDSGLSSLIKKFAYVGNGNLAAALGTESGLFIRLYRALSQPVQFWPIVQVHLNGRVKESNILDVKSGVAYHIMVQSMFSSCVTVKSQIYAHRSRPALLVQDIQIQNPSSQAVVIELDQIGASGWDNVETETASFVISTKETVNYKIYSGLVPVAKSEMFIPIAIATVSIKSNNVKVEPSSFQKMHILTSVHYSKPLRKEEASKYIPDSKHQAKGELEVGLNINEKLLRQEHTKVWEKLWFSGFSISHSMASGALNGDHINKTIYYVLSNAPAPLHNVKSSPEDKLAIEKILYYPDRCYGGHTTLVSPTLWIDPEDESQIARVVTTWMITLEKQGCSVIAQSGAEGIMQAMILSLGPLHFHNQHLEMTSHPSDLHRDLHFRRVNYGNNTHLNISVVVGDDNKASIYVALDRNDKPYYGCDAGCLDPPIQLSNEPHQFPVKLTDPPTSVLYITADKQHMEELKHAIHVKEVNEAPAHEHHVIALHKHGHHFGGLPTIFWVSIAFLIIIFHLFLFKLIYNEYCQGQERFTRSRYNL
ncbi:uncharacterized protein KIAA2013 homolog isoform X1 [Biomphalaria glabrata]|uniref:Uncharacterized protein KIAA2013 homolog isoform X1 n=1 Tax=Biomphalaria glabrata TaxID=6526 RepID=A0A9U8EKJ2_BIOGL|nr:uncharacterized protein KIAA2013 homolog isoform X1 [Biomphalaria glabrata]